MNRSWLRQRLLILHRTWSRRFRPVAARARTALALAGVLAVSGAAYRVSDGDTLSGLAERFGVSVRDLVDANGIADPDLIYVGQTLTIPGGSGGGASAPAPAGADGGGSGGGGETTHVVARGESLGSIARRYGLAVDDLARANGIADPSRVMAGSLLRVAADAPPAPGSAGRSGGEHTVARGENLSSIASRYGTTVSAIVEANDIADPNRIVAGRTLTVPGGSGGAAWTCPVAGASYINDFGVAKPDGRFHEGVDVYAPRGTVVRAPVSGRVEQVTGSRGGLQFVLHGDDGYRYIGAHMDAFGASGRVAQGTPLGEVGDTGNARGAPTHLHLEMHNDGVVNPYPTLRSYC